MPLTLQFAVKRIRKTKNCQKGYGCGNSCINKGRKCKKKFGDQASTYAGWLKKNAAKTIESGKDTRKKLNKITGDAVEKFSNNSHSDRRAKLDKLSNDKAVELIVKHTVDGQMDSELRTSVAELIDKSKKEVIKDVGEQVTSTVEKAGMSPTMKRKGDGKNIINPEYRNLTDDLAKEVLANQSKFVKGKRSPAGGLTPDEIASRVQAEKSKIAARKLQINKLKINLGANGDRKVENIELAGGYNKTNSKKERQFAVTFEPQSKSEAFQNQLFLTKQELLAKIPKSEKILDELIDSDRDRRAKVKELIPDTDGEIKRRPGETAQDFLKRRSQDPEVQKRQVERDKEQFRRGLGILPDRPIGEIGTSGLGGRRRGNTRTSKEGQRSPKNLQDEIKNFKIDSSDPDTVNRIKQFKSANNTALNAANKFIGVKSAEADEAAAKMIRKLDSAEDKLRGYSLTRDELTNANVLSNKTRRAVREAFADKAVSNLNKAQEEFILKQAKEVEDRIRKQPVGRASNVTSSDREILRKARQIKGK